MQGGIVQYADKTFLGTTSTALTPAPWADLTPAAYWNSTSTEHTPQTFRLLPQPHLSWWASRFSGLPVTTFTVYLKSPDFLALYAVAVTPVPKTPPQHLTWKSSWKSQSPLFSVSLCYIFLLCTLQQQSALLTAVDDTEHHTSKRVSTTKKSFTANEQKMEAFSLCWAKEKLSPWVLICLPKFTLSDRSRD